MDYKEFVIFEKSFENFLLKLKSKQQIEVHYHLFKSRINGYDFAFIGYRTKTGWHGIHYCNQKKTYYFGVRTPESCRELEVLAPGFDNKIPEKFKEAFLHVVNNKINFIIRR